MRKIWLEDPEEIDLRTNKPKERNRIDLLLELGRMLNELMKKRNGQLKKKEK